jgi:hypothetical protein
MVNTIEYLVQVVVQYSIRGTFKVTQTSTYCTVWCTRQYHEILQFVTYRKSVSSYLLFPLQHKVLNYVYMYCVYTELRPHVRTLKCTHMCVHWTVPTCAYSELRPHVHTLNCTQMYVHWTTPTCMYTKLRPYVCTLNYVHMYVSTLNYAKVSCENLFVPQCKKITVQIKKWL